MKGMSDQERPRLAPEVSQPADGARALELPVSGETELLVLARRGLFCVCNARGDITPAGARDLGLYHEDTRHLSYLELFVAGGPPQVLSSGTHGAATSQIDLTLTDRQFGGFLADPQNFLHIRRKQLLDQELVEQIVLTNHLRRPIELWLELRMAADFADVFEVRGARRRRRGTIKPPQHAGDRLILLYQGLDGELYRTEIRMSPEPKRVAPTGPFWDLRLMPGEARFLEVVVQPLRGPSRETVLVPFDVRRERLKSDHQAFVAQATRFGCNNLVFEEALKSSLQDLDALRLSVDGGEILGAGIPWFAAPFGRDSILTSWELLPFAPQLAVATLRVLARYQGQSDDPWREEEPGKILHELRRGEMVRTGEVPHSPYYGAVDSTPLWLMLLGETWRWLGDRALIEELKPNAERALAWIERRLDEGNGFVRYQRRHELGLEHQGWKDSRDGVSFPDGTLAAPPIALVEVQGYVVGALHAMARLLLALGEPERARRVDDQSRQLMQRIHATYWVPASSYYALALDGEGRQVPTLTSNPGHLLFAGACLPEHGSRVVDVLLSDELFSGYGVRTVARGQAVYNPLSYHNGSVWPHDSALCALGAAYHHRPDAALKILSGLYHAALHFRRQRLPELFCGLGRGEGDFLVKYPVSCSPQGWASASFFMLLWAALGLRPDAPAGALTIVNPKLPLFLDRFDLSDLRVGDAKVALRFKRHEGRTHVDVIDSSAPLRIRIELE
jgi:glycogen debranching enzyme